MSPSTIDACSTPKIKKIMVKKKLNTIKLDNDDPVDDFVDDQNERNKGRHDTIKEDQAAKVISRTSSGDDSPDVEVKLCVVNDVVNSVKYNSNWRREVGVVKKTNAIEIDDKYPCLRRALSCTETPILPLGTYAVEFGFDVSNSALLMPFDDKKKLTNFNDKRSTMFKNKNSVNSMSPSLFVNRRRLKNKLKSTSVKTKQSISSVGDDIDDEMTRQRKRFQFDGIEGREDPSTGDNSPSPQLFSSEDYEGEENEYETTNLTAVASDDSDRPSSSGEQTQENVDSTLSECQRFVAKVFKKDNRTWLWKSSAKRPRPPRIPLQFEQTQTDKEMDNEQANQLELVSSPRRSKRWKSWLWESVSPSSTVTMTKTTSLSSSNLQDSNMDNKKKKKNNNNN